MTSAVVDDVEGLAPERVRAEGRLLAGDLEVCAHELGLSRIELDGVRLVAPLAGLGEEVPGPRADLQEAPLRRELA